MDNPGRAVSIDLTETELENRSFGRIETRRMKYERVIIHKRRQDKLSGNK